MASACTLRPPRPGDCAHVIRRHGELYREEYDWDERFEELVAGIIGDFENDHDPATERMWVADLDGEVAGAVLAVRNRDRAATAQLRCLYVEPAARGRGIGTLLVDACIAFCREVGYERLVLWTQDNLDAARRIYVRAGFRLTEETPHRSFGHDLVAQIWELDLRPDAPS